MSDILQLPQLAARVTGPSLPELVADSVRQSIERGSLQPGSRLPSEPELASRLGVSRSTVRHALSVLEQEGLVVRQHGLGTFVSQAAEGVLKGGLAELMSTTELIRSHGFEPGSVGARAVREHPPNSISSLFPDARGGEFIRITRTRTANGLPVIHCEDYVPADILPAKALPSGEAFSTWSLYKTLAEASARPALAHCKVAPIVADGEIAQRLHLKVGHPLLLLKQLHYTQAGRPVLYSENWHNSALIEFQITRRA